MNATKYQIPAEQTILLFLYWLIISVVCYTAAAYWCLTAVVDLNVYQCWMLGWFIAIVKPVPEIQVKT